MADRQGTHAGLTPESLRDLQAIGSPAVRREDVVAVVQQIDGDRYRRRIWRWDLKERSASPVDGVSTGEHSDFAPGWSPSGERLAFISDRGGTRHLRVAGGELQSSAAVPGLDGNLGGAARHFAWLDDERLGVVIDVPAAEIAPADPAVISWLRYKRDGRSEPFDVPAMIAVVTLAGEVQMVLRAGGAVMDEMHPGGCISSITALAAAGNRLAYVTTDPRQDQIVEHTQLRVCDLESRTDSLCWDCPAPIEAIAAAGDHLLAVSRGANPTYAARRAWALDLSDPERPPRRVFPELEESVEYSVIGDTRPTAPGRRVAVDADGTVHLVAGAGGDIALLRGGLDAARPERLTPLGTCVTDFAAGGGALAVCLERPEAPAELHRLGPGEPPATLSAPSALSALNRRLTDATHPISPSTFTITTPDGLELTSWLSLPSGAGPHPLLVRIHGGPHLCMGNGFSLENQIVLAAGFAVLTPNVRGSDGWGDELRAGSVGQWGAGDFDDLIACIEEAIRVAPIDPTRLYLSGGSYGGYLTNWAITRTDRFRAAIAERATCNLLSKYGNSDNGFDTNRTEMDGADLFDDSVALLLERSPLRHATAVSTPLLLIHGERDQRVPIEQSEQWFAALRRLGGEVVFVRYPGESHDYTGAGSPAHRIDRLTRILAWLQDHR